MRFIETDEKGLIKPRCLETVFRNTKEKIDFEFSVKDNSNGEDKLFPIPLVIVNP